MAHESFGVISPLVVSTLHPTSSWSNLELNFNIRWKHVRCTAKCKRLLLIMSMGYFKKDVTPLKTHWSDVFLALTRGYNATVHPRNYAHRRGGLLCYMRPGAFRLEVACLRILTWYSWPGLEYISGLRVNIGVHGHPCLANKATIIEVRREVWCNRMNDWILGDP